MYRIFKAGAILGNGVGSLKAGKGVVRRWDRPNSLSPRRMAWGSVCDSFHLLHGYHDYAQRSKCAAGVRAQRLRQAVRAVEALGVRVPWRVTTAWEGEAAVRSRAPLLEPG